MKRLALVAAASCLAAIPAVIGLTANPALSHRVPVRVPSGAQQVQVADTQPEAQHKGRGSDDAASPSAGPSSRRAEAGDNKGGLAGHVEPGDDRAGVSGGGVSGGGGASGGGASGSGKGGSGGKGGGKSGGSGGSGGGHDAPGHN